MKLNRKILRGLIAQEMLRLDEQMGSMGMMPAQAGRPRGPLMGGTSEHDPGAMHSYDDVRGQILGALVGMGLPESVAQVLGMDPSMDNTALQGLLSAYQGTDVQLSESRGRRRTARRSSRGVRELGPAEIREIIREERNLLRQKRRLRRLTEAKTASDVADSNYDMATGGEDLIRSYEKMDPATRNTRYGRMMDRVSDRPVSFWGATFDSSGQPEDVKWFDEAGEEVFPAEGQEAAPMQMWQASFERGPVNKAIVIDAPEKK